MPPTLHARLGASSSKRWINCPGSIALSEGLEDTGSFYAWEGTAAHELGERCLNNDTLPHQYIGEEIEVVIKVEEDGTEITTLIMVTEEMAEAVDVFVEYVRECIEAAGSDAIVHIERQGSLEKLNPPGGVPMFGTADVVIWNPVTKHLMVIDYKHGRGVVVEVEDNSQVRYYALIAAVAEGVVPDTVEVTIVQPRAHHEDGVVRTDAFDREELIAFKHKLFEAAERTLDPDAPLKVGSWCKFCPAHAICPEQKAHALELAQVEFDIQPAEEISFPAKETLTVEELAVILQRAPYVMDWLREVESHALSIAEQGGHIPGYKLVRKRTNRRWTDEERAENYMARKGLKKYERNKVKLISPNQAEKALKARGEDPSYLEKYWDKPEGGPKLVPSDDARPEIPSSVEDDFDLLPPPAE